MVLLAGGFGDLSFPIAILIENDGVPLGLLFDALILGDPHVVLLSLISHSFKWKRMKSLGGFLILLLVLVGLT